MNEQNTPVPARRAIDRRSVVRAGVWTVPVVTLATAAPAFAASNAKGELKFDTFNVFPTDYSGGNPTKLESQIQVQNKYVLGRSDGHQPDRAGDLPGLPDQRGGSDHRLRSRLDLRLGDEVRVELGLQLRLDRDARALGIHAPAGLQGAARPTAPRATSTLTAIASATNATSAIGGRLDQVK